MSLEDLKKNANDRSGRDHKKKKGDNSDSDDDDNNCLDKDDQSDGDTTSSDSSSGSDNDDSSSDSGSDSDDDGSSDDSDGAGSGGRKSKSSKSSRNSKRSKHSKKSKKSSKKCGGSNGKKKKSSSRRCAKPKKVKIDELLARIHRNDTEMLQEMKQNEDALKTAVAKLDDIDFQNRLIRTKSRQNQRRILHAMHPDDEEFRQHKAKAEEVAKHYRELLDAARTQQDEIYRMEAFIASAKAAVKQNKERAKALKNRHVGKCNKKKPLDESMTIVRRVDVNGFVKTLNTAAVNSKLPIHCLQVDTACAPAANDCKYEKADCSPPPKCDVPKCEPKTFPVFNPTACAVEGLPAPAQCGKPHGVTAAELHPLMEMVVQKTAEQQQQNTEKLMAAQKSVADHFLKELAAKNNRCC